MQSDKPTDVASETYTAEASESMKQSQQEVEVKDPDIETARAAIEKNTK